MDSISDTLGLFDIERFEFILSDGFEDDCKDKEKENSKKYGGKRYHNIINL